jgi:trimethylguanosine synthase
VCGDFIALAQAGRFDGMGIDAVFVSPPWGGPSYIHQQRLSLADFPIDVQSFWEASRRITKNVALFLPRNLELQSLKVLKVPLECESNYLNDRCISMTVYAGDLIAKN